MIIELDNSDAFCDVSILAESSRDRTSDGFILGRGVVKPYTMLDRWAINISNKPWTWITSLFSYI